MKLKIVLALFVTALLVFGCIGGQTPESQGKPTDGGTKTADNKTGGAENKTNGAGTNQGTGADILAKTFTELVTAGLPTECKVNYKTDQPVEGLKDTIVYFKGSKFKMTVTAETEGMDAGMIVIDNGDGNVYYKFSNAEVMTGLTAGKQCEWIKIEKAPTEAGATETPTTTEVPTTEGFDDANTVELDCKPALFGDEMFLVIGKACTMDEIIGSLPTLPE